MSSAEINSTSNSAPSISIDDELHFRSLADHLQLGMLVHRHFVPLYANQAFADLFGYESAEQLLALDDVKCLYPESSLQIIASNHEARLRGDPSPTDYDIRGRRRDGSLIWLNNRPVRIEWSGSPAVCTTLTDITRQIDAEEALKSSEEGYRRLFENAPEGIIRATLDGHIIDANPAMASILGFQSVDALKAGVTDMGMQIYADPEARKTFVDYLIKHGSIKDFETQWHRQDGCLIWVSLSSMLVPSEKDDDVFLEGTAVEVTQRHNAVQSLMHAKEHAERASRAKSEFLAHMSHELRTPLNCVIGFSQILMDEMFGSIGNNSYREYAGDIFTAGNHLLRLISDILDISKIEAGELEIYEDRVDMGAVLVSCMKMIRERADKAGIIIAVDFDHDLPKIFADELRIKQILLNLLSNAVKFTPSGGRATASAYLADDGGVVLKVTDTGVGIDPEDIDRVMAPFEQVKEHPGLAQEGTGLGVFLSKALTEMHGGSLKIESALGEGTMVTVSLPPERTLEALPVEEI